MSLWSPNRVVSCTLLGVLCIGAVLYARTVSQIPNHPFMAALIAAARSDPAVQKELGDSFTVSWKSGFARQRGRSSRLYTGELYLAQDDRRCFVRARTKEPVAGSPFTIRKLFIRCRS